MNIDTAAARRYLGMAPRMPKRFFQRVLSTWDGRSRRIEEAGEAARVWQRAQSVVGKIELLELGELADSPRAPRSLRGWSTVQKEKRQF